MEPAPPASGASTKQSSKVKRNSYLRKYKSNSLEARVVGYHVLAHRLGNGQLGQVPPKPEKGNVMDLPYSVSRVTDN